MPVKRKYAMGQIDRGDAYLYIIYRFGKRIRIIYGDTCMKTALAVLRELRKAAS